jgi:hypothetical protein
MAAGVNSKPKLPNGPLRESSIYTTSPATTGGSPINVPVKREIIALPLKLTVPMGKPKDKPNTEAIVVLKIVTTRVKAIMPYISVLNENISLNASMKLPANFPKDVVHPFGFNKSIHTIKTYYTELASQ